MISLNVGVITQIRYSTAGKVLLQPVREFLLLGLVLGSVVDPE